MKTKTTAAKSEPAASLLAAAPTAAEILAAKKLARRQLLADLPKSKAGELVAGLWIAPGCSAAETLKSALPHAPIRVVELPEFRADRHAGLDCLIICSDNLADSRVAESALAAGVIPVIAEEIAPKAWAQNYDAQAESGNAFFARDCSGYALFAAAVRALETHKFSYDWQGLARNAAETAASMARKK